MKLFLIEPAKNLTIDPWFLSHHGNKIFGMVIRAKDEQSARLIAQNNGGEETHHLYWIKDIPFVEVWISEEYSTCVEITNTGKEEVLLRNHRSPWKTLPRHILSRSDENWAHGWEPCMVAEA